MKTLKIAALATVMVVAGCGAIGKDKTVVGPCPAGYVRDTNQPGNVCVRVGSDGGVTDPLDIDGDHDGVTPRNGDCRDDVAMVNPRVTAAQARARCEADLLGNDGIDFDCAGSAPVCRAQCGVASDCNDGDSCTTDRCANGRCEYGDAPDCRVTCPDDRIACTADAVVDGACRHDPDDALCGADERCNPATGCEPRAPEPPVACRRDAECSDGLACNGAEQCEDGACVRGDPVACDDPDGCLVAACDDFVGGCFTFPEFGRCGRGEACNIETGDCEPTGECVSDEDCNDGNRCNGAESCNFDGFAHYCRNGSPLACEDGDPRTVDSCVPATGECTHLIANRCISDADCNDGDQCNGAERCNARGECVAGVPVVCEDEPGFRGECRPRDGACILRPIGGGCVPAPEACGNARDDDCDGFVDEGCVVCAPSAEVCNLRDDDCDGLTDEGSIQCGVGACQRTVQMCVGGVSQTCTPGVAVSEICGNGIDEDCDGTADDGCGGVVVPAADQTTVRTLCFDVLEASFPGGSCTPSGWTAVVWDREGNANRGAPGPENCISTVGYRRGAYIEFSAQCGGVYYDAWSVGRRCSESGCRVTADGRDVSAEATVVGRNPRYYLP